MRRAVRVPVAALAAALLLGGCGESAPGPEPTSSASSFVPLDLAALGSPEDYADAMITATNAARTGEGLDALSTSTCAEEQARLRAADLVASGGELVHAPMDPVTDACRADAAESMTGENLSRAAASPEDVVDAWMASPGHRSNILTPEFTEIGISCTVITLEDVPEMLCAQIFLG